DIEPWLHSSLCLVFLVHCLFYQRGSNMALFLFPFLHNYMDLTFPRNGDDPISSKDSGKGARMANLIAE
ncbi:hypothetical protein, partial [Caldibacillus debilis]|uniref:hypothetical protein n=1 Tax=Caldibacillus debilis TaxID=301148 RepID=UPI0023F4EF33